MHQSYYLFFLFSLVINVREEKRKFQLKNKISKQ